MSRLNSPKSKSITPEKDDQQVLTFKRLKPANIWNFCLENDSSIDSFAAFWVIDQAGNSFISSNNLFTSSVWREDNSFLKAIQYSSCLFSQVQFSCWRLKFCLKHNQKYSQTQCLHIYLLPLHQHHFYFGDFQRFQTRLNLKWTLISKTWRFLLKLNDLKVMFYQTYVALWHYQTTKTIQGCRYVLAGFCMEFPTKIHIMP